MNYKITTLLLCMSLLGCKKIDNSNPPNDTSTDVITDSVVPKVLGKESVVYTTADNTSFRLTETAKETFIKQEQPLENEVCVFVNPNQSFQSFLGIGGAITDAAAEVFSQLPPDKQNALLTAYYDKEQGIGYSLCRTPIHSSDFSSESFTYIEEGDKALKTFSIDHDKTYRIPLIKRAIETAGGHLLLYASPWSPPAFMKSNNNMLHGGKLLPEYFDAWARYYAKFIKAYEAEGMPIWGITIQNEPMAVQRWESCIYTAEEERDFLKNHLGPTLEREGLGDKNIVVWDHNRDLINHRANTIFEDPEAAKYAWGIGFHWYETWAGGDPMFSNPGHIKESFPSKNLLFTEGCQEGFRSDRYQYWKHAERYGRSMINDFNQGTVGWTDWNILLNQNGGPNHVGNYCFAPIHGDTETKALIYTPTYYYIGHFSKFIRPGAKRISTVSSRSHLLSTSFMNEDNSLINVIMNQSDKPIDYKLYIGNDTGISINIPAHAIQTVVTP
ncbi:glycoside hydrolase family 30 protein [Aestuariivivens sediminis]|uniref:glycoside hydrolase family 30 protein n=1 Tax=Aestuariivivens sediminis TaxID=2913557 RepID=UPI001F55E292|nr:glycoside hydrolase family 30 protein [Aestuariivivens sediminis]